MTDIVRKLSDDYMVEIKKNFSQLYKEEAKRLILNEDMGVLRETIERITEIWAKGVITEELDNEAMALVDIGISCIILDAIIDYKRYKLEPERILIYRTEYDPMDVDAAFRYFVELMNETYRTLTIIKDLEDARKEFEKVIELWKEERVSVEEIKKGDHYIIEESLATETILLADIANRSMILYNIIMIKRKQV